MIKRLLVALALLIPGVASAQYMDGLPVASSVPGTAITMVCVDGTAGHPGTCKTRQAPMSAIQSGITSGTPVTGNDVTNSLGTWTGYLAGAANPNTMNLAGLKITSQDSTLQIGNQTPTAGSLMKIDNLWSDGITNPATEGSIWSQNTYAAFALSQTMTSTTVPSQGGSPLTSLFVTAYNNGATGDVVAALTGCIVQASGGACWGGNQIARNSGTFAAKLVGDEIDVEFAAGSSDAGGSAGLYVNEFNIASNANAIQIGSVGGGSWLNGVVFSNVRGAALSVDSSNTTTGVSFINTTSGLFSTAAIELGTGASQSIDFGGGNFGTSPFAYGDTSGNFNLVAGTGGFFVLKNASGTTEHQFDSSGNYTAQGIVTAASYTVGTTAGVSCTGVPTSSAVWTNGIRTAC